MRLVLQWKIWFDPWRFRAEHYVFMSRYLNQEQRHWSSASRSTRTKKPMIQYWLTSRTKEIKTQKPWCWNVKEQRRILSKDTFHRVESVVVCSIVDNVCGEEFKPKDLLAVCCMSMAENTMLIKSLTALPFDLVLDVSDTFERFISALDEEWTRL